MGGQRKLWLLSWERWICDGGGTIGGGLGYAVRVAWEIRIWVFKEES